MINPAWYLTAWVVVAAASAWKFWRLTAGYRRRIGLRQKMDQSDLSLFRSKLEKSWKEHKSQDPI